MIATISLIATMILLLWLINIKTSASNTMPKYKAPLAKLSERVSIQAADRGNPRISLTDGRNIITLFSGPRHLVNALENNQVQGNFIGTDVTGTKDVANLAAGIYVDESSDNTIGGTSAGARNIISGNGDEGVAITNGATRSNVQGNFIGTDVTGTRPLGNSNGVTVTQALEVTIGGADNGARNIISGNLENGIGLGESILHGPTPNLFGGTGTVIQNNFIGTDLSGTAHVPNAENGIFVETESVIYTIKDNLIAFNGENGIFIPNISSRPGTPGFRVQILSNFIFSNEDLPIELGNIGINPNDDKDPDAGANELQNSPVLNSATLSIPSLSTDGVLRPAAIAISGTFNSTPNTNFTLEFYFGLSCSGEGSQLIGFVPIRINTLQVTTDGNGNVPYMFSLELPGGQRGGYVNCTATNPTGNTSEFSECITVGAPSPIVTTTVIKGKNLSVHGGNFERGANIVLNGQLQKTKFNSISLLTGKKLGKKIKPGDKLKISNPNGTESEEFTFAGS